MPLSDHLDKLKAFQLVAETGKLREAAERSNLTQPSLTRLIQTLEDAAGEKLFHRSRQGVTLTEAGQLLLEFSKSTLKDLEDLEERLKNPASELAGLIRVGSYESLAEYLWPEFLPALRKTYPDLKVALKTNNGTTHQQALASGELDLLVDAEPRVVGDFTSWVLYEDRFNFYGHKQIPQELAPDRIRELPVIYCPAAFDQENKTIRQHLEEAGYDFKERIELDSFTSVATFTSQAIGLGILPQRLAKSHLRSKHFSQVALKGFSAKGFGSHHICATVRSASDNSKRLRMLVKLLKEHLNT